MPYSLKHNFSALLVAVMVTLHSSSFADSNSNHWLGKTVDEAPELYRLADAFEHIDKDCPPILFMTGEFDNPSRNQPSRDRLQSLGIQTGIKIYKDGKHGCWNQLPWFTQMVSDMDTFFQETL